MYDAPLTDLGKKQAKSLGGVFKIPRDALGITPRWTPRQADASSDAERDSNERRSNGRS